MRKAKPPVETLERIDPVEDEDFSDVDGDPNHEFALKNADPNRREVWVHNDPETIGEYKGSVLKYEPVYATADGREPRPEMDPGYKAGEIITRRDHVLMSCDRALYEKRERFLQKTNAGERARLFKRDSRGDAVMRRNAAGQWAASGG